MVIAALHSTLFETVTCSVTPKSLNSACTDNDILPEANGRAPIAVSRSKELLISLTDDASNDLDVDRPSRSVCFI